ncbi:MAG: hypothetical protein NTY07_20875 [Bacteroidia bacterium]|nr:hypothetical protein [Bacteroidia bacterium]
MKRLMILLFAGFSACTGPAPKETTPSVQLFVSETTINQTIDSLKQKKGITNVIRLEKGVKHAASLWHAEDGTSDDFVIFCKTNYVVNETERELLFDKVSKNFESIFGHFNKMSLDLKENVDLNNGPMLEIDKEFSAYSVGAHLLSDLYSNKIAFIVALNFPYYSLEEKGKFNESVTRKEWAMARLGDIFVSRVPAELQQASAKAGADADIYISEYNIEMGRLRTDSGKQLFPDKMVLLSHWNLRDEIKASYANKETGKEKQEMIYKVMERIINQDIPEKVINNPNLQWMPYTNKVFENSKEISCTAEPNKRYQQIINNFKAEKAIDAYSPEMNTFILRKFSGEMEVPQVEVELLFDEYLRSPQLAKIAAIIEKRLGRSLRPYDIWYDGFKARSVIPQEELNSRTTLRYPNPKAFEADMPNMLGKLGWPNERAQYISAKIAVDPARGSGHAWGAQMKGEKAHLRTRIPETGMDYKGYNIAVHEFGHNVEQTISLYDIDHYLLNGVPNTAFTEALAFIFQSRDLQLLGINNSNPDQEQLNTLDTGWSLMEIMGVGMVDMKIWKWLYAHPESTAAELKAAVQTITKDVWNTYFSPVFGIKDEPILGIYSHMISNPLYLAAYSYGQIIEFQLEEHLNGKCFPNEIDRIYKQGRIIPQRWMEGAVGSKLSVKPIMNKLDKAIK